MFTDGLDTNALRWVRENDGALPHSTLRTRMDPVIGTRKGGRGFGLPPASKFRSGHLPASAIPVTSTIRRNAEDSGSASENDMSTDSEEEVYGRRYSLDSSPRDDIVSNRKVHGLRNPLQGRPRYTSDCTYSDVSSSVETMVGRQGQIREKGSTRYPVQQSGYSEDESSDSAASSEFSTTQVGSINGAIPQSRAYASEGYTSSAPSRVNTSTAVKGARKMQNGKCSDDDIPSAPPFSSSAHEIRKPVEQTPASRAQSRAGIRGSAGFKATDAPEIVKSTSANHGNESASKSAEQFVRATPSADTVLPSSSHPPRLPAFHAIALGPWHAVIAYDACVRLCLNAWARGCMEAPMFLENECLLLRDAFSLQKVLLQSEEELLSKRSAELASEGAAPKPKKIIGKMKVQVRKVKMALDPPTGCNILALKTPSSLRMPSLKMEVLRHNFSNIQSTLSSKWQALGNVRTMPRIAAKGSFSRQSLASTSYEVVQETYSCLLRLKSTSEEDAIRLQPGSGESHVFFPDGAGDDLIVEVQDSKGKYYGRVLAQVATIADDPADKLRWWSIYREPDHELVGKLQLYINYSTSSEDNGHLKYGTVAETVAYDLVLEVAMKVQQFQQRNLLLDGPWKWLLTEFASYYGVSDVYSKLRYLSYIMDVATPTADCLKLVYELLIPVLMKGQSRGTLSHQENRILGEGKDQIEQILALVFENYKSLDESTLSGIMDVFRPATGVAAPALEPAIKLYTLLHDILSPEAQTSLCQYFQTAARKRSRRHLTETEEYVTSNTEIMLMDPVSMSTAYQKMTALCMNIKNEISTDIEIHNQHILPSFIDLPNLSSSIYSSELCNRVRAFLTACPPSGPSPPVAELVIATSDFQRDLASWKISPVKGGIDAKELFHLYILVWIQDKRMLLLESCKLDKVKWSGVRTQHSTTPFVDEMYDRLRDMLNDYEVIICRWPEYIFVLENAIADIEKAVVESLDKQYADVLSPLKDNLTPKKFGLKYVQKFAKRSVCSYTVPDELGVLLNSLKRMIDILRPKIELQFKSWGSCMPISGNTAPGERLSEVAVMLRAKFRNYLQAVVEKLAENSKSQASTKLKKVLQDSKGTVVESDVRGRMQPLREQLTETMNHLHTVFETHVFVTLCRGYWDRMGQDVLSFLENRKENRSWYKGSRIAVSILDDAFASQMQQLLGNTLQEKDLEPPRSIMEVRSILCKDAPNHKDSAFYY
ncbi:hypothetical protein NL676_024695 [Syzygium grande]|nr:hypothetical protein NL676_024695 [Syzygium grande]